MTGLDQLSVSELLRLSVAAQDELRRRGVTRSSNMAGDFAERLFAEAFGWTLEPSSTAGYDAVHEGVKYQIKCRRPTARNPSRQMGEFSKFEEMRFDVLAAVLFEDDFGVNRAAMIPFDAVKRLSSTVLGRRRFMLRDSVWKEPDVRDVTAELREALIRLNRAPSSAAE